MTNSEKIIEILYKGNLVRIEWEDSMTNVIFNFDSGGLLLADDGTLYGQREINMQKIKYITPIYKKPKWKVGDLVDVSGEYGGGTIRIEGVTNATIEYLDNRGLISHVPFHAISAHIPNEESGATGEFKVEKVIDEKKCVGTLDKAVEKFKKIEKLDYVRAGEMREYESYCKINEIIDKFEYIESFLNI